MLSWQQQFFKIFHAPSTGLISELEFSRIFFKLKVIFHKRKQHVHHSSKYLFRHAHEVCKAREHGTEGSQHIKSSGEEGGGISFFHSLFLPLNFYFLKSCTIARLPDGSILFLAKSRTEKFFTQKAQKL